MEIFDDIWAVSKSLKKTEESGSFFRIGRDFGEKVASPVENNLNTTYLYTM